MSVNFYFCGGLINFGTQFPKLPIYIPLEGIVEIVYILFVEDKILYTGRRKEEGHRRVRPSARDFVGKHNNQISESNGRLERRLI